jgi:hypothetical protein
MRTRTSKFKYLVFARKHAPASDGAQKRTSDHSTSVIKQARNQFGPILALGRLRCAHAGFRGVSHRCRDHRHQSVNAEPGDSFRQGSARGCERWENKGYGRGRGGMRASKAKGEEGERPDVIVYHSLCFRVTVFEFGVYYTICAIYIMHAS